MGQQQLILLVLVFIIAGIATVVAINTFQEAQKSSAEDAIRQDILNAASSAQRYYMSTSSTGGGGQSFTGITFNDISLDSVNTNASYSLSGSGNTLVITGTNPSSGINLQGTITMSGSSLSTLAWEDL